MSKEVVLSFIQKVNDDGALQEQVKDVPDLTSLVEFARTAGYTFSTDDWKQATAELALAKSGELTNQDLEQVVGGATPQLFYSWGTRFISPQLYIGCV